jgi:hypothetical protein
MTAASPSFTATLMAVIRLIKLIRKNYWYSIVLEAPPRLAQVFNPKSPRPEVEIVFQPCLGRGVVVQVRRRSTISGK